MVRTIKLELSDEECEQLAEMAGKGGLSVSELLENFIQDLVGGERSNGSDERECAKQWYDRCWFGMFPERTFLCYLLKEYGIDIFRKTIERKRECQEDIKFFMEDLTQSEKKWENAVDIDGKRYGSEEEYRSDLMEYLENLKSMVENAEEKINDLWGEFLSWTDMEEPDMKEEMENIEQWQRELEELKEGNPFEMIENYCDLQPTVYDMGRIEKQISELNENEFTYGNVMGILKKWN